MVLAAAVGVRRATRDGRGLAIAVLTGTFAVGLFGSAAFPPDPMAGFPPGAADGQATVSGILHLAFGAIGFLALAAAAFVHARWSRAHGLGGGPAAVVLASVVVAGFVGGAALAAGPAGVGLLWLAVVAGWTWLALASVQLYRWTPHPMLR